MAGSIAEAIDNLEENADGTVEVPTTATSKDGDADTGDKGGDGVTAGDADAGDKGTDTSGQDGDGDGADKVTSDKDVDKADNDGGYIADELEDKPDAGKDEPAPVAAEVSPELKYIIDGLPTLSVRGKQGADGAVKTFAVKAAGQLPDDFEFASKREEMMFVQALGAQEMKAQSLQSQYQREQQQKQSNQYTAQENADIRSDISDLQREGSIPKFKYNPSDKRFNDDAGVKAAQEVMEFMNEKNQTYAKAGKLYRVSFKDAFAMMAKPTADKTADDKQTKEDKERKTVSRQLAGSGSASARTLSKPRPAASMEDLINRLDSYDL